MSLAEDKIYTEKNDKAWEHYNKKEIVAAKSEISYLISTFPKKVSPYYLLGLISFDEKNYGESVSNFKKALDTDVEQKSQGYIRYWLGMNYKKSSDYDWSLSLSTSNPLHNISLAKYSFEKALEHDTYPEETIDELYQLYRNDYLILNSILKKAIEKFPSKIDYIRWYSCNLLKLNKREDSINILTEKASLMNSSSLYFELGQLVTSDPEKARLYFYKALGCNLDKNLISISYLNYNIGSTYYKDKNWIKAGEYFKKAYDSLIEHNIESPEFKYNNFWISAFGILACHAQLNKSDDAKGFINTLPFIEEYLDGIEFENIFHLDSDFLVSNYDMYLSKNIEILNQLHKKSKDNELIKKISWLKVILLTDGNKPEKRLDPLRDILTIVNEEYYNSSLIFTKISETYSECLHEKISDNDLLQIVNSLKSDLTNFESLRTNFVAENLSEIFEFLSSKELYKHLIDLKKHFTTSQLDKSDVWFNIAYAYNEISDVINSQKSYEYYLSKNNDSGAALNNLANIYGEQKEIISVEKAIELYERALTLGGKDELYTKNLNNTRNTLKILLKEKTKSDHINKSFQRAVKLINKEDYFTLEILYNFLLNIQKEDDYTNFEIAIQDEYFPTLMNTNYSKAEKLRELWISKNYILLTDKQDDYKIPVYQINPFLEEAVTVQRKTITENDIPDKWLEGIEGINFAKLEEIQYFNFLEKIKKINKKYQPLILRDFNELVFNYLVGNIKSTIVLSGSFVELILTYHLERKKHRQITYVHNTRSITKNLYDCNLINLISFCESNNYFGKDFIHLTNLSRIYRNFVHPGLELQDELNKGKSDICFISTLEIFKLI